MTTEVIKNLYKINFWENFLNFLNNFFKNILINRSIKKYENLWKPYGIIIWENILKFHNNDQRKQIKKEIFW